MFEILFKIWYTMAILPFLIFIEGSKMFSNFLKKRKIYMHWDILHSSLFVLVFVLIIVWINGYR